MCAYRNTNRPHAYRWICRIHDVRINSYGVYITTKLKTVRNKKYVWHIYTYLTRTIPLFMDYDVRTYDIAPKPIYCGKTVDVKMTFVRMCLYVRIEENLDN